MSDSKLQSLSEIFNWVGGQVPDSWVSCEYIKGVFNKLVTHFSPGSCGRLRIVHASAVFELVCTI